MGRGCEVSERGGELIGRTAGYRRCWAWRPRRHTKGVRAIGPDASASRWRSGEWVG